MIFALGCNFRVYFHGKKSIERAPWRVPSAPAASNQVVFLLGRGRLVGLEHPDVGVHGRVLGGMFNKTLALFCATFQALFCPIELGMERL